MTMKVDLTFTVVAAQHVSPRQLWWILTEPRIIEKWLCRKVEHTSSHTYTLTFDDDGQTRDKTAEVVSACWLHEYTVALRDPGYPQSTVNVAVSAESSEPVLTLTHQDVPLELAEGYTSGWKEFLECAVSLANNAISTKL